MTYVYFLCCNPNAIRCLTARHLQPFVDGSKTLFLKTVDGILFPVQLHMQLVGDVFVCAIQKMNTPQRSVLYMSKSGRIIGACHESERALGVRVPWMFVCVSYENCLLGQLSLGQYRVCD